MTPVKLQILLGFAAPYRARLMLAGFLMLAETGVALAIPWLGGHFAGKMLAGVAANTTWLLLTLFMLFACQACLRFGHAYLAGVSGERILADLRIRIYDHLQSLPLGFYHQRRRGDILALLTYETTQLSSYITGTLLSLVPLLLMVLGAVLVMLRTEAVLGLAVAAAIPVFYLLRKDVRRKVLPELDDEFAKDLGAFESLGALRDRVRGDLQQESDEHASQHLRTDVLKQLADRVTFDLPPSLVMMVRDARSRLSGQLIPPSE